MLKGIINLLKNKSVMILIILILGALVRVKYATTLPVTNDEGAYLYDTLNIRNGMLPLADFLTKSIPFIYLLAFTQEIFGNSLTVGRIFISLISLFTSIFLYLLTKNLFDEKRAIIVASFYWAFPLIAAYTTLIHTEPLQSALTVSSFYFLFIFLRNGHLIPFLLSVILISTSFFVRQSSLVSLVLPTLFGLYFYKKKLYVKTILYSFFAVLTVCLVFAFSLSKIGFYKSLELVGVGAVNLSVSQKSALGVKQFLLYPLNFINEFVVEASNLFRDGQIIFIFFLIFFVYFVLSLRKFTSQVRIKILNLSILGIFALVSFLQSRYQLFSGLWKIDAIPLLLLVVSLVTMTFYVAANPTLPYKKIKLDLFPSIFVIGWLMSLFSIYLVWIKFRSPYLIEFFPPMLILMSVSMSQFFDDIRLIKISQLRNYLSIFIISTLLLSFAGSYFFNKRVYFTGLHSTEDVLIVKTFLMQDSPHEDTIFTASAIFPYVSGDRVIFDISHPAWYGYPTIPEEILHSYFPPFSQIEDSLKNQTSKFVIRDPFTDASYFGGKRGKALELILNENYTLVKAVGRASIYERNEDIKEINKEGQK